MSQNKFMHPRNIYRRPPNYKEMAIQYPEFRKYAKPDISGKITVDFKNPEALKSLTCTLLQKDFGLLVDMPTNRLIPTVPLRLNYILWIEDLLSACGFDQTLYSSVHGIDIGTGASCIYPLLAAKKNKWHMLASEVDEESFEIAQKNVENNNLSHFVSLKLVGGSTLLTDLVKEESCYTFSMCNPPFFSCEFDLDYISKSRSPSRHPPNNVQTGDVKELIVTGGEVAFITKMMKESKEIGTKIKIYTCMVGQKSSLGVLKQALTDLEVANMVDTRFCQGNTTRWGIAWTFDKKLTLQKAFHIPSKKKTNIPMSYVVPHPSVGNEEEYSVEIVSNNIINILTALEVTYSIKKKNKHLVVFDVRASKNTWSHQRSKRRQSKRPENTNSVLPDLSLGVNKFEDGVDEITEERKSVFKRKWDEMNVDQCSSSKAKKPIIVTNEVSDEKCEKMNPNPTANNDLHQQSKTEQNEINVDEQQQLCVSRQNPVEINTPPSGREESKEQIVDSELRNSVKESLNDPSSLSSQDCVVNTSVPLLEITLIVRRWDSDIHLEMLWVDGTGGRDVMHQILQYIKNKLNEKCN